MKDVYISGSTDRVSPEAPVPIVRVKKLEYKAGGAANVALNAAEFGLQVTLISLVGNDDASNDIENLLNKKHINCIFIRCSNLQTIQKHRIISQNQQIIRLDYESDKPSKKYLQKNYKDLLKVYKEEIYSQSYSAVVFSDYKKGVLKFCDTLISATKKYSLPIFVDPKGKDFTIYKGVTLLKPNLKEFESIVGVSDSEKDFNAKAIKLKNLLKIDSLLITKGSFGMILFHKEEPPVNIKADNSSEVFDVTGAGDTVLATLVASIVSNFTLIDSVSISSIAAGIVVRKFGTSNITLAELKPVYETSFQKSSKMGHIFSNPPGMSNVSKLILKKFLEDKHELNIILNHIRSIEQSLVFTNGCFDILHSGHVHLFQKAKECGNFLIVAINSDKSVQNLKGLSRPINCINDRIDVIKSISYVDFIVVFSEDTPENLIKEIKPSCLVKGGDYIEKNIIGSDFVKKNGGSVKVVPLKKNLSTTKILKRYLSST